MALHQNRKDGRENPEPCPSSTHHQTDKLINREGNLPGNSVFPTAPTGTNSHSTSTRRVTLDHRPLSPNADRTDIPPRCFAGRGSSLYCQKSVSCNKNVRPNDRTTGKRSSKTSIENPGSAFGRDDLEQDGCVPPCIKNEVENDGSAISSSPLQRVNAILEDTRTPPSEGLVSLICYGN